jgi:predicted methyltransferase
MIRPVLLATAALTLASACAPQPDISAPVGASSAMTRPPAAENAALAAVVNGPARTADMKSRDPYRRPVEALTFWGLRPGMTVLEVGPGAGWWTEILAPYALATGGRFIATGPDLANPAMTDAGRKARADFVAKYADTARYGKVDVWNFGPKSAPLPEPGSVDFILVARAFHNWARQDGFADKAMRDLAAALKPGGVLAVEQHRAPEGVMKPETGYVPESYVIAAAERAGLKLDARSELNANPKDDRDHPFGVWTLQPVRATEQDGRKLTDAERAEFDAIGESDRMTLRFVKPA